jgi:hypothetical protein
VPSPDAVPLRIGYGSLGLTHDDFSLVTGSSAVTCAPARTHPRRSSAPKDGAVGRRHARDD